MASATPALACAVYRVGLLERVNCGGNPPIMAFICPWIALGLVLALSPTSGKSTGQRGRVR